MISLNPFIFTKYFPDSALPFSAKIQYTFLQKCGILKLFPQRSGPKTAPKRTAELEKRVIQLRLTTEKDMYSITQALNAEGFPVKSRLIAQILADYGISKKK